MPSRNAFAVACVLGFLLAFSAHVESMEYETSLFWTDIRDVEVVEDYAYCAFGNGLVVVDVSDESHPRWVRQVYVYGGVVELSVRGSFAYMVGRTGLHIVHISDPLRPELVCSYDVNLEYPSGIWVAEPYAYVTDARTGGMCIVDISDP